MIFFRRRVYSDVLYEWLNSKNNIVKESTYHQYFTRIEKYILPYLGNIKFKRLKKKDIMDFFDRDEIFLLSSSTKLNIYIMINSSIKYGLEKRYRKKFKEIDIKFERSYNEITYFTKKEQFVIDAYLNSNLNLRNLAIMVSLYTGMRIGEVCALKGTDIDFVNNTISINKTVQRVRSFNGYRKTKLIIDRPKTRNSVRVIPVPKFLVKNIRKFVKNYDYYVFTGCNRPKDPRALEKYFNTVLKRLNLKQLNYHALRHTYATRLREQKVDIKVISELLGHSSWKITQEIYVHASFESKRECVDKLGSSHRQFL